jgi:hypothetical protein
MSARFTNTAFLNEITIGEQDEILEYVYKKKSLTSGQRSEW